jgi:hypothetical protein
MMIRLFPPMIGAALLVSGCSPESALSPVKEVPPQPVIPVGPETSFIKDPSGSRLTYQDNHGEYVYTLQKLGLYSFTSLHQNKRDKDSRKGIWTYKQTGPKTGVLTFDGNDVWNLKFTSPHRATAKTPGDARGYMFEFEWL